MHPDVGKLQALLRVDLNWLKVDRIIGLVRRSDGRVIPCVLPPKKDAEVIPYYTVLTDDGKVWDLYAATCTWTEVAGYSPIPVPAGDVAFWHPSFIITRSGQVWGMDGSLNWYQCSPPPGGGVSVQETTWGWIKAQYGE